eukprot:g78563.t1
MLPKSLSFSPSSSSPPLASSSSSLVGKFARQPRQKQLSNGQQVRWHADSQRPRSLGKDNETPAKENARLKAELKVKHTKELESVRRDLDSKTQELDKVRRRIETQKKELELQRKELLQARKDKDAFAKQGKELQQARREVEAISKELEKVRRQQESQNKEMDIQRKELQQARRHVENQAKHAKEQEQARRWVEESQTKELQQQRKELEQQKKELQQARHADLSTGKQALSLDGARRKAKELEKVRRNLEKEINAMRQEKERAEKDLKKAQEHAKNQAQLIKDLEKANREQESLMNTKEKELHQAKRLLAGMEQGRSDLETQVASLRAELKLAPAKGRKELLSGELIETMPLEQLMELPAKLTSLAARIPGELSKRQGNESQDNMCVVCLEQPCNIVFLPCRHMKTCTGCSDQLTNCPLCRADITDKFNPF